MASQMFATVWGLKYALLGLYTVQKIGLFKNDFTPVKGFDPSLLTECDFSGYAKIDIGSGAFPWPPFINSDGNAEADAAQITFTKTGAVANDNVYGFFYTLLDATKVIAAQRFVDGPYAMSVDGDFIKITPLIVATSPLFP